MMGIVRKGAGIFAALPCAACAPRAYSRDTRVAMSDAATRVHQPFAPPRKQSSSVPLKIAHSDSSRRQSSRHGATRRSLSFARALSASSASASR